MKKFAANIFFFVRFIFKQEKQVCCLKIIYKIHWNCYLWVSLAYGVFISQLIRYARTCSSYECFILRAVRLSNKLFGQGYVKERLKSSLRKFYGRYGDLTNLNRNNIKSPTRHSGWWQYTVTPCIDRILHQFLTVTDLDLITEFDFLPNCARFP